MREVIQECNRVGAGVFMTAINRGLKKYKQRSENEQRNENKECNM